MRVIRSLRERRGLSQRELARRSELSFRALQLAESAGHDARLSSIEKVARGLGLRPSLVREALSRALSEPPESAANASRRVVEDGAASWKVHLFDFVDAFRRSPSTEPVSTPVSAELEPRLRALFAATVETLTRAAGVAEPDWARTVGALDEPWFPAGFESLKASALVESPVAFRARNVFVLGNFLARA